LQQPKFLLIIILFISYSITTAQVFPEPKVDSLLKSGIDNIINQNYDLAKKDFVILDREYPHLPLGKIYFAAVEMAKSYDLALPFNSEIIENKLDEAKEISEDLLDKDEDNIWYNYFLALSHGYKAYFNALTGNWLSAFGSGVASVNLFEKCIKINPDFYEALIAIGTYKYWKSKEMQFLGWLPFISDNRDEGIILLEKAVRHSSYNSYLAINSLIWIYIDKDDFEKSIKLAQAALFHHPKSRFFKFGLARAYEDIDLSKSIEEYYNILNSFSNSEKKNRCNEIMIKHLIAQQYVKLGKHREALDICNDILSMQNLTNHEIQKMRERLERVKKLKNELLRGK
jgi:tetratricopeptide (TPR) repeat protein